MQKAECGLNISGSCYWDNDTDGSLTVKHETESLITIVNIFGCALWTYYHSKFNNNYYHHSSKFSFPPPTAPSSMTYYQARSMFLRHAAFPAANSPYTVSRPSTNKHRNPSIIIYWKKIHAFYRIDNHPRIYVHLSKNKFLSHAYYYPSIHLHILLHFATLVSSSISP
jgi:hypothetical protein